MRHYESEQSGLNSGEFFATLLSDSITDSIPIEIADLLSLAV